MRFFLGILAAAIICPQFSFAQESTVYALDVRTRDNFITFAPEDPMNVSFIDKVNLTFAMDFDNTGTTLYAVNNNLKQIGEMDQLTGEYTSIATFSGDFANDATITGLSFDPTDGTVYMSTATTLYTLDVNTGVTTLVGTFLDGGGIAPQTIIEIAINAAGEMFAHALDPNFGDGIGEGALYAVDKANAEVAFIGFNGLDSRFAQGMDFDPDTDVLYAAVYTGGGTGSYGTWNTTTGAFTEILDLPSFGDVELEMCISGGTTYAFDLRGIDTLITFPLNAPVPFTTEESVNNYFSFAYDFDDLGNLVLHDNDCNCFGTVDVDTGCFTPGPVRSGDLAADPAGMAFDPTTGMFWILSDNELFMADPSTGATILVSALDGVIDTAIDIAIDNDGNMYIFDIGSAFVLEGLYEVVDPATGAVALIGDPGVGDAGFAQGMDFDPATNTLYQAIYTGGGTGSYGSWDIGSGVFTEILDLTMFPQPIPGGYELEMAIRSVKDVLLGDVNCDGIVDLLDVSPFVDLVINGGFSAKADINGDGVVSLLDVAPFVAILTGG